MVFDHTTQISPRFPEAPGILTCSWIGPDNVCGPPTGLRSGGVSDDYGNFSRLPGRALFDHEKQQLAAVSRGPGNIDLFVIASTTMCGPTSGTNRPVGIAIPRQCQSGRPLLLSLPGRAVFDREKQQLAVVSRGRGNIDLFMIGFDNRVWTTYWNEQAGWDRNPDGSVSPYGHFYPVGLASGWRRSIRAPEDYRLRGASTAYSCYCGPTEQTPRWTIDEIVERLGHRESSRHPSVRSPRLGTHDAERGVTLRVQS